jgi:hypothetical protein
MGRPLIADQCTRAAYAALTPDAAKRVRGDARRQCDGEIMVGTSVGAHDFSGEVDATASFQVWDGRRLVMMMHQSGRSIHYEREAVFVTTLWNPLPDTVVTACIGGDVSRIVDMPFAIGRVVDMARDPSTPTRWKIRLQAEDGTVSMEEDGEPS